MTTREQSEARPEASEGSGERPKVGESASTELPDVGAFARNLIRYRDATNASVTSWGRTILHNRAVGGVAHSLHLLDLAVDVVYDQPMPLDTVRKIADHCHLLIRRERDHDHIEPAG